MRGLFWTGLIGLIVSFLALIFCLLLPIINGPRTSWGEALAGIIPAAALTIVFLVLFIIGLTGRTKPPPYYDDYDDFDGRRGPPPRYR